MQSKRVVMLLGSILLVLVIGLMPLVGACAKPAPEAPVTPTPPEEVKTLKVGCTVPLNVALGVTTERYLKIIFSNLNEAGGLVINGQRYNVDLIVYDDKYAADVGRAAVERLVHEDKVKFMVGQLASAAIVSGLPITEAEKVPTFCGGASPKIIDPANKYTVRTGPTVTIEPTYRAWVMANSPVESMVTLSPDDETGKAMSAVAVKCAEAYGVKVLDQLYYPRGTTDFAPVATKIATLNPDEVNFAGSSGGTDLGLQLKELYLAGWRGVRYLPALSMAEVASVCTKEQMEGAITYLKGTQFENPSEVARELKNSYEEEYGTWDDCGVIFIGTAYAFIQAVQKADSLDPDDVMAALKDLEFDCPMGYTAIVKRPDYGNDRFCDAAVELHLGQIKDGTLVSIGELSVEDAIKGCEKIYGGTWR